MESQSALKARVTAQTINSRRLLLRPLLAEDAAALFAIYGDEESTRFWPGLPLADRAEAQAMVRADLRLQAAEEAAYWSLVLVSSGRMIGRISLFHIDGTQRRAELGFAMHGKFRRKGYMREALQALLETCFTDFKLQRMEADVDPENHASLTLLRGLGFREEGRPSGRWQKAGQRRDSLFLGLLKSEWQRLKAL